jgi:predicted aspartyl protease
VASLTERAGQVSLIVRRKHYCRIPKMELARLLATEGYLAVGLARSNSGLLEVPVWVGGGPATLLLDTGAIGTCIDQATAQRLELCPRPTEDRASGVAAGDQPVSYVAMEGFRVGPCSLPGFEAMMIDFSHVNKARQKRGDKPIDGVLGSDILAARAAVIDYGDLALYLREAGATAKTANLAEFFASEGCLAVRLVRSKSGLLEAPARIGAVPATIVVDTGAGRTCLDSAAVQRLALSTRPADRRPVGFGGTLKSNSYVTVDELWIGPCCLPAVEAVVTDLSHVHTARTEMGDQPFDGILGADVLGARSAKLDYSSLTLYLSEREQKGEEVNSMANQAEPGAAAVRADSK